jgi:hypothetical protein
MIAEENNDDYNELIGSSEYPDPELMLERLEMACWARVDYDSLPDATLEDIADDVSSTIKRNVPFATFKNQEWYLGHFWPWNNTKLVFSSEWRVNPRTKTVAWGMRSPYGDIEITRLLKRQYKFKKLPEQCPGGIPTLEQLAYAKTTRAQRDFLRSEENTIHRPHNLQVPSPSGGKRTRNKRITKKRNTKKRKIMTIK